MAGFAAADRLGRQRRYAMPSIAGLTKARIFTVFAEEVAAHRGHVTETSNDGRQLFTRSVLPQVALVRPRDQMQGGVALKATAEEIWLYPYLFRLICKNGAIIARTLEARPLADLHLLAPDAALRAVRESIQACCAGKVFTEIVRKTRTACESKADLTIELLAWLATHGGDVALLSKIRDRFDRDGDRSRFGLANAITATARDTIDPDLKWNLETLGGGIAIGAVSLDTADERPEATARLKRLA
jgi:hypothetical protein